MTDPEPVVCVRCGGAGEIFTTIRPRVEPPYEVVDDCQDCDGQGVVEPDAS